VARTRFRYSPWDGTQSGFELDEFDLMEQLSDDLLYHGDVNSALRELLQRGLQGPDGQQYEGLRDLLERLRERRRDLLEQFDLGGVYDEIADGLREVVDQERTELQRQVDAAEKSGDERRQELARDSAANRNLELDMLPSDLAGRVEGLQRYEFTSAEAAERFEQLIDQLREQLVQQFVDQVSGAMSNTSPEDLARMKDMLAELNEMLAQRAAGEEPDFDGFMERHGDFFPENPQNLDELLEVMAQRMAAMQAMLNSMTPEQRAQLQQLSDQLLEDMDLNWQMQQLGSNLRDLFPDMNWESSYDFEGRDPIGMSQASEVMSELGDLDQLEQMLKGSVDPGALAEVDVDRVRQLLGDGAADSLNQLSEVARRLSESGMVERREGRLELTARGLRRLGQNALGELFRKLDRDRMGSHELEQSGVGHERSFHSKPYEWGDPFQLDLERTVRNALLRGETAPIRLHPDDFEIEQVEHVVRSSTVLLLDLSLSMPMRGNFLPAKKVAMALHTLISSQYPRDYLGLVAFSETARVLTVDQLPEATWDYVYGTNMQHAFQLARQLLAPQSGTKQILMITDGEPTAHINSWGEPEFHYPPIRETVDATMLEVGRCTREGIRINTFMLDPDPSLQRFVEQMTRLNQGRAFFTTPDTLGDYVLVDFIEQRRELLRGRR
jgi:uncharacterized protein with von Willebrand factor type A (vWA) domain